MAIGLWNSARMVTGATVAGLLLVGAAVAEVYKWQDETGRVHYGERPPEAPGPMQQDQRVETLETYECTTDACRAEEEQLAREAAEQHEQTVRWLEARQQEKRQAMARKQDSDDEQSDDEEAEVSSTPPANAPPVWPFGVLPGVN